MKRWLADILGIRHGGPRRAATTPREKMASGLELLGIAPKPSSVAPRPDAVDQLQKIAGSKPAADDRTGKSTKWEKFWDVLGTIVAVLITLAVVSAVGLGIWLIVRGWARSEKQAQARKVAAAAILAKQAAKDAMNDAIAADMLECLKRSGEEEAVLLATEYGLATNAVAEIIAEYDLAHNPNAQFEIGKVARALDSGEPLTNEYHRVRFDYLNTVHKLSARYKIDERVVASVLLEHRLLSALDEMSPRSQ